jgi:uncharacterized Ntn-hydrolase superfamily protein
MVGSAIASSSICVASRCAFVRSGIGVAVTQNVTNPDLGPLALDLMSDQVSPPNILKALAIEDTDIQWRQIGVLNLLGEGTTFSGSHALGTHATAQGKNCIALGNLLDNSGVPEAMIKSFENCSGHLAERLLIALEAGLTTGGELGTVQSAGLLVAARPAWPVVDLRVDWHMEPISELRTIWHNYRPQMDAYINRAKDPANAEPYSVPGDE